MTTPLTYVGIDNGLTGALVAISAHSGAIIDKLPMPTQGKQRGREIDVAATWEWLSQYAGGTVLLETPGKHSPGVNALCSMWDSYGALRAMLELKAIRHHRIAPQTWQKKMLPGCEKGQTKPMALSVARRLWPNETWMRTERCSKEADGFIDAGLLAEYGRRERL